MNSDMIWQIVRYLLVAGGSWLTTKGYVDDASVQSTVGALGTLFGVAWGLYVKWNTRAVPAVTAARSDVPVVSAATGTTIPGSQSTK